MVTAIGWLISAALLLSANVGAQKVSSCPNPPKYQSCSEIKGFTDVGGSCYATIYVGGTQEKARAECKKLHPDADLATIRCDAENKGIWGLSQSSLKDRCSKFSSSVYSNQMIIGFSTNQWLSGANVAYRNWNAGEPNGPGGTNPNKPEGLTTFFITNEGPTIPAGKWNDAPISWGSCAAACEVIVATSGKGCQGQGPCGPAPACSSNTVVQSKCSDIKGFTDVGGSCYSTIFVGGTQEKARAECKKLHPAADLATIRCDAENKGLWDLSQPSLKDRCSKFSSSVYSNQMIIGFSTNQWLSGANVAYRNWNAGEPNGPGGTNPNKPEGLTTFFITNQGPTLPAGKWNDAPISWGSCAAACEVIVPTSGQSCQGQGPCGPAPTCSSNTVVQSKCSDIKGFTDVGGSCYSTIFVGGTQEQARAECKKLHPAADLATIRCDAENKAIWDLSQPSLKDKCGKFTSNVYANQLLIGFSVDKWLSGADIKYRNWNSGEPNGIDGTNPKMPDPASTLFIANKGPTLPDGKWNDAPSSWQHCAAACEVILPTSGGSCPAQGPCGPVTNLPCFTNNNPIQSGKCEDISGFTNVGGSCYAPVYVGGSIAKAKEACKKLHPAADLATIRCDAENEGVWSLAQSKFKDQCSKYNGNQYANQLLIGISQGKWSSGSNTTYTNWNKGEPNGGAGEPSGSLFFVNESPQFPKGKWNDHIDNQCAAMCEVVLSTSGQSCNLKPCAPPLPCVKYNAPIAADSCAGITGFTDVGGSCYAPVYVGGNMEAARAACKKLHPAADLATVRCDAENKGIFTLASSALRDQCSKFGGDIWRKQLVIGLQNNQWLSGSNTTYRNWNAGEPNGGAGEPTGTFFIVNEGAQPDGKWNDSNNDNHCAAMCEVIVRTSGNGCGVGTCQ